MDGFLGFMAAESAGLEHLAGKTQLGNMKLYFEKPSGRIFTGNQYVKTIGLAKVGKGIGIALTTANFINESMQAYNGDLSPAKYQTNRIFDVVGLYGGFWGTLLSVGNSLLNAYSSVTIGDFVENMREENEAHKSDPLWHIH